MAREGIGMTQKFIKFYNYLDNAITAPTDSTEERIRKRAYTLIILLKCFGCVAWAMMYVLLGLTLAAWFPTFYGLIILASIAFYFLTKNFSYFVNIPLFIMLVNPVPLQWILGGFAASGTVMLWSILAPLGALVFRGVQEAKLWFAGFISLILVSVLLEGFIPPTEPRQLWVLGLFFAMNIGGVTTIVFAAIVYFVKQLRKERDTVEEQNRALEENMRLLRETQNQMIMQEKMASLGDLVAGVAHEMNTPLGAIGSTQDTMTRALDKLQQTLENTSSEEHKDNRTVQSLFKVLADANQVMADGTGRVSSIVNSLRQFAQLDEAEFQVANIHEGIDSTLTLLQSQLGENITLVKNYGDIKPVYCSPGQMNQVFMHLLKNALQAIEKTGEINVSTFEEDDKVYVRISDTGVGISSAQLERIFDFDFHAADNRMKVGFGLSTAYRIIQDHNGEIQIESAVGKGTEVTISLPIEIGSE